MTALRLDVICRPAGRRPVAVALPREVCLYQRAVIYPRLRSQTTHWWRLELGIWSMWRKLWRGRPVIIVRPLDARTLSAEEIAELTELVRAADDYGVPVFNLRSDRVSRV